MVMSSNIFAQRYVDGRSLLRYLPLFNTMNNTFNPLSRLPSASLQDADDPRARAKEQGRSPRPTQDKTWPLPFSGRRS
jgi:hypothetical protein